MLLDARTYTCRPGTINKHLDLYEKLGKGNWLPTRATSRCATTRHHRVQHFFIFAHPIKNHAKK